VHEHRLERALEVAVLVVTAGERTVADWSTLSVGGSSIELQPATIDAR